MSQLVRVQEAEPGITVAVLQGRLTLGNTLISIETTLLKTIRGDGRNLVVDLSEVTYIDSAAIGMLIGCHGEAEQAGGRLRVANPQETVARSFQIVHLDRIVAIDGDVETAIRVLRAGAAAAE